jgi:hypothetical protein
MSSLCCDQHGSLTASAGRNCWQTFFDFGEEKDPRGEQFSQGMNYVFEATVRYLFRRVTRRAGPAFTLITEKRDAAGNRRELLHPRPRSPRPSTFVITDPDHPDR